MKTPWGERLLIVPPFHRLQAVRALCGSGTQLQTQALLHEKIRCLKQLGLKGKSARSRKLLFYVLLSLSCYCFTHFSFLLFLICLLRCHRSPSWCRTLPSTTRLREASRSEALGVCLQILQIVRFCGLHHKQHAQGWFSVKCEVVRGDEDLHPCVWELVVLSWETVDCPHWEGTNCCSNLVHDMGENEAWNWWKVWCGKKI